MTHKGVIFDLDGTLIDSMWLWKDIDQVYLKKYGHDLPEDLQEAIEGMSFSETASYFKNRFQLPDSLETIKGEWNQMAKKLYQTKVTLKPNVVQFLDYLKERQIPLGIGTSNSKELVETILARFNLTDYFTSVRTSCEVDQGKPSPDIYLQVAKDLGLDPGDILVFEDIPNGIRAANRAGMTSVAVYDPFSESIDHIKKELADLYIYDYLDIVKGYINL